MPAKRSSNAVAKVNPRARAIAPPSPGAQQQDAIGMLILKAAADPAISAEKVERLVRLQAEMAAQFRAEEAKGAFWTAMSVVQGEMRTIAANANNPQTKSNYADIEQIDNVLKPIYTARGLAISFTTESSHLEEHVKIVMFVALGIHVQRYDIDMPADGKGAKGGDVMTLTHAKGAAVTYGQRYLLKMAFNIAVSRDTDGNAVRARANAAAVRDHTPIDQDQLRTLIALADEVGADKGKFCGVLKVDSFAEIPAERFDEAMQLLERKRKANAKKKGTKQAEMAL